MIPGIRDYVIIDADMVLYQPWDIIAASKEDPATGGRVITAFNYMPGDSRACQAPPYYATHAKLSGNDAALSKAGRFCGIAHHMPIKLDVLHRLFEFQAEHGAPRGLPFWQQVLQQIDITSVASFSEYIYYFNFATRREEPVHRLLEPLPPTGVQRAHCKKADF